MNILQLQTAIAENTDWKSVHLDSIFSANLAINDIDEFPIVVILDDIPTTENRESAGNYTTIYRPIIQFVDKCDLEDTSTTKQELRELMLTKVRRQMVLLNKHPLIKNTNKRIDTYQVDRQLDTQFDENTIVCSIVVDIPHVDTSYSLC